MAKFLALRLKRRLQLKTIAISLSLRPPFISGWFLRPCDKGGREEDIDETKIELIFVMKP
jgi:hypothetical protein